MQTPNKYLNTLKVPALSHTSPLQMQHYISTRYAAVMSQPAQQHYMFHMEIYLPYASIIEPQKCMNTIHVPLKAKVTVT